MPSITSWTRIEPDPASDDLQTSLSARVLDPLWMLARQWQFDELRGEDGGTPVSAVLEVEHTRLGLLRPGTAGAPVGLTDDDMPLEPLVEAEAVAIPAERVRAQAGLQLLRRLTGAGMPAKVRADVIAHWAFVARPPEAEDVRGSEQLAVFARRVPDAARAEAELAPLLPAAAGPLTRLPPWLKPGTAALGTAGRQVLADWLRWYRGLLAGPAGSGSWNPNRQEYAFAVQGELTSRSAVLDVPAYTSGRLDWPDFDAVGGSLGPAPAGRAPATDRHVLLPTPARFPGMPADRLWAFEDANVYLGGIEAGPTDLARMALVEFSLTFGVDWFVLPVDVAAGSMIRVAGLTVRDTFGSPSTIGPARQASGWSMFGLTASDDKTARAEVFIVPPVLPHVLESEPLEEVALFRDEMANLVWGVERVVQGKSGEPVDRRRFVPRVSLRQTLPGDLDDASIVYRLMSPVPDHWVPFVAVQAARAPKGALELERRPLVHFRDDGTVELTHPRGILLLTRPDAPHDTDRLRIAEEEVPRDGAIVTRRYQLARTPSGRTLVWLGRQKRTGEGEGWSGLRFDTALPPAVTS